VARSPVELAAWQEARRQGRLGVRATLMVAAEALHDLPHAAADGDGFGLDLGIRTGWGDEWLRIGAVKVFSDGSLIGRTAAMCCGSASSLPPAPRWRSCSSCPCWR
jgi:predicted amidohydrolase YtcJ